MIVLQGEAKPYLLYRHGMVPIISPDGQRIVFTSGAIGKDWKEVWVGDVTGDSPRKLAEVGDQQILASPAWSPDGRWVAYGKDGNRPKVGGVQPLRFVWRLAAMRRPCWPNRTCQSQSGFSRARIRCSL